MPLEEAHMNMAVIYQRFPVKSSIQISLEITSSLSQTIPQLLSPADQCFAWAVLWRWWGLPLDELWVMNHSEPINSRTFRAKTPTRAHAGVCSAWCFQKYCNMHMKVSFCMSQSSLFMTLFFFKILGRHPIACIFDQFCVFVIIMQYYVISNDFYYQTWLY